MNSKKNSGKKQDKSDLRWNDDLYLTHLPSNKLDFMRWLADQALITIETSTPKELGFEFDEWFSLHESKKSRIVRWNFTGQHKYLPLTIIANNHGRIHDYVKLQKSQLDEVLNVIKQCKTATALRDSNKLLKLFEE